MKTCFVAVSTLGTTNWEAVAAQVSGKSAEECKQYYCSQEKNIPAESKKKVGQVKMICRIPFC